MAALTEKEIKDILVENKAIFIRLFSRSYLNKTRQREAFEKRVEFICQCGENYIVSLSNLKKSKNICCWECQVKFRREMIKKKFDSKIPEKKKRLEKDGATFLSHHTEGEGRKSRSFVTFICKCGKVDTKNWNYLDKKQASEALCSECSLKKTYETAARISDAIISNFFKQYPAQKFIRVLQRSKNAKSETHPRKKIEFLCKCGNKGILIWNGINFRKIREPLCRVCARERKRNLTWNKSLSREERIRKRMVDPENPENNHHHWAVLVKNSQKNTCFVTGVQTKKFLEAHHIFNWKKYPDKRFDPENGVCLLKHIHLLFHKKYGKKDNNLEQLLEFKKEYKNGRRYIGYTEETVGEISVSPAP